MVGTRRSPGPKALRLYFASGGPGVPRIPGAHATTVTSLRVMVSLLQRRPPVRPALRRTGKRPSQRQCQHMQSCVTCPSRTQTSDATASSPPAAHFARKGFMDELSQQLPLHKCKQEELLVAAPKPPIIYCGGEGGRLVS